MKHKKNTLLILAMVCCLMLSAVPALAGDAMVSMPNPMVEATAEEVADIIGITVNVPENATEVQYFIYEIGEVIYSVEGQFTVDDVPYIFSAAQGEASEDLSGIYETFETEEEIVIQEMPATLKLNEGGIGTLSWHDSNLNLSMNLSMMDAADADTLTAMAEALVYTPAADANA